MALSISTNTGALMAAASASSVNKDMETSMERLSTGKRINSASDDAAGVAIASRLTSEIKGTNQAIRNAQDAQGLINTAEGAHKEVENILQRMRELAVQSANDTNSFSDRDNLEAEYNALSTEIDRIADVTTWAGQNLLDGTGDFDIQVGGGTNGADTVNVAIDAIDSGTLLLQANLASAGAGTAAEALTAIDLIDTALGTINTQRASLGSISNRLDNTVSNLTNISIQLEGGRGRIEDADFAAESTSLAKSQILQQASTAMLAQANASKQNVLSLLQG
jgi:flagellin